MKDKYSKNDLFNLFNAFSRDGTSATPAEVAINNDKRIEATVTYYLTKGYTNLPPVSKTIPLNAEADFDRVAEMAKVKKEREEYFENINRLFKDFKSMVMRGEMTIEELEDKVYTDYGVVSDSMKDEFEPLEFMSEDEYISMRIKMKEYNNGQK